MPTLIKRCVVKLSKYQPMGLITQCTAMRYSNLRHYGDYSTAKKAALWEDRGSGMGLLWRKQPEISQHWKKRISIINVKKPKQRSTGISNWNSAKLSPIEYNAQVGEIMVASKIMTNWSVWGCQIEPSRNYVGAYQRQNIFHVLILLTTSSISCNLDVWFFIKITEFKYNKVTENVWCYMLKIGV